MTVNERLTRAMSFLMILSDYIEPKLDQFERRVHKCVQDEFMEAMKESNKTEPPKPPQPARKL